MGEDPLNLLAVQSDRCAILMLSRLTSYRLKQCSRPVRHVEERVQIFVVATGPPSLKARGQEDGVDPVRFVIKHYW